MNKQQIMEILIRLKEKYELGATNEVCSSIRHESLVSSQAIVNAIYLIEFHSNNNQKPNTEVSVRSLNISTRALNILHCENINNLNDLLGLSYFSLLRIPNNGHKTTSEIVKGICDHFRMPMIEIPKGVGSGEKLVQPIRVLIGLENKGD